MKNKCGRIQVGTFNNYRPKTGKVGLGLGLNLFSELTMKGAEENPDTPRYSEVQACKCVLRKNK